MGLGAIELLILATCAGVPLIAAIGAGVWWFVSRGDSDDRARDD